MFVMIGLICCAGAIGLNQMPFNKPTIMDLDWMAGAYACSLEGGTTFEEHWSRASGNTLIGMGRMIRAGQTLMMESMSVEQEKDDLVMYINIGMGSKPAKRLAAFTLTKFEGKKATFENPKNDFPSVISYEKLSDGGLLCWLKGISKGKEVLEKFDFKPIHK